MSIAYAQQTDSDAREHFDRGMALYASRNFDDALAEFRTSHGISGSPNALLAVARCLRELERFPEAVVEYQNTIAAANARAREDLAYAQTRDVAAQELRAIADRVGQVRIQINPPEASATVRLNGRVLSTEELAGTIPMAPGLVVVEAEAKGYAPAREEVAVPAGRETYANLTLHSLDVVPAPPPEPPKPSAVDDGFPFGTLGWISLGVGVAGVASFVVFHSLADGQHDDLVDQCVDHFCSSSERGDLADTGRTYQLLTNLSLGVGIAGLVAGATLLVLDFSSGQDSNEHAVGPAVFITASGAEFHLRF